MTYFFSVGGETIEVYTGTKEMEEKKTKLLDEAVIFTVKDSNQSIVFTNE